MPNLFAYFMLFSWPLWGYLAVRKITNPAKAGVILFLVPYLLLPYRTEVDLPLVPPIDKVSMASITAFLILSFKYGRFRALPDIRLFKLLLLSLLFFPVATMLTNGDAFPIGFNRANALGFGDLPGMLFENFVAIYVPFMVGVSYLGREDGQKLLLQGLVVGALIYSLPMLWEVRMSPQLHKDVYGFFGLGWGQQFRQGGWRPVVFLQHGLLLAMFFSLSMIAAVLLAKKKLFPVKRLSPLKLIYMIFVLFLCKTWSAFIYGIYGLFCVLFLSVRKWLLLAFVTSLFVFLYPILRGADLVPVDDLAQFFAGFSEERAQSLQYRFDNEDILLERAGEKPLFGWGGWGRARVYDPITGEDISTTDGTWIIVLGEYGWFGYAAVFGLLSFPIVYAARSIRRSKDDVYWVSGICLLLSLNLLDLIPNSSVNAVTYLMAGSIIGFLGHAKSGGPIGDRRVLRSRGTQVEGCLENS